MRAGLSSTMKKFKVYKHPDGRLRVVKEGFSIPGVIFGSFWLLWHQVWVFGGITGVIGIGVYWVFPSPEGYLFGVPYGHRFGTADVLNLIICGLVGVFGNEWLSASLAERGFERVSVEIAQTADGAKAEYLRDRGSVAAMGSSDGRKEPYF
jgi:Protein of unknown function (DUF2628)